MTHQTTPKQMAKKLAQILRPERPDYAYLKKVADRQRIAELFPTAHRVASVASDRQRIAEIGVGPGSGSWHPG